MNEDYYIPKRTDITTEELFELYPDLAELYNKYLTFEILKREVPEPKPYSRFEDLRELMASMK